MSPALEEESLEEEFMGENPPTLHRVDCDVVDEVSSIMFKLHMPSRVGYVVIDLSELEVTAPRYQ